MVESPVQSQSIRYGGGALLPSEQRYVRWRSGLLPSEYRNVRMSSGALPSQGRIAAPPGGAASLRYGGYNFYYNQTADSMSPSYNTYNRRITNIGSAPSIRYGRSSGYTGGTSFRVNTQVNPRSVGTYSFRQNFNTYTQVNTRPRSLNYRTPSLRY